MSKKIFPLLILFVFTFSIMLIAEINDVISSAKTKSTSRTEELVAPSKFQHNGPIYRPASRQAHVLFVEDPGMSGFGPLTKPDPQWTHYLDMTVGAGNYGWWGPVVDSSDGPPVDTMNLYELVIWNCYDWWWGPPSFAPTPNAIANMQTYMDGSGKVWLIGQDINVSHGGLIPTFLGPYFEVQSLTDDILWNPYNINCNGAGVLTGFSWTDSSDFQANGFFSDDITPTANGQIITIDATDPYDYNIITNDFRSSFWTIDGRVCTPDAEFVAVVDSMLKLFGIGAVQDTHDVGVRSVVSPPAGPVIAGAYDVIGNVLNYGTATETFDVTATVWDTTGWTVVFGPTTLNLANFPAAGDTNLDFGQVTFGANAWYYTEIYTALAGDTNPANDTATVVSTTAMVLGDIIFEMNAELAGDNQLLGVEFDGTYFYVTGGAGGTDPNKVYVIDTLGTLIWTLDQPGSSTGWGWRDIAFDDVYAGPDRIDTLYASVSINVDPFGIDLAAGTITYYTPFTGAYNPNRALAWKGDSAWFYTASFRNPVYWFTKTTVLGNVANSYAMYGAAYDTDPVDGGWIWWHSQDDPGTGWLGQISQYDPATQSFTGLTFGYSPTITVPAVAGGACFYEGFRGADVLFTLVQGTPDAIVGLYIRSHGSIGVEEDETPAPMVFGLSQNMPNPFTNGRTRIAYTTPTSGPVSLKIYDNAGRLVRTLVDAKENAGRKTVHWNGKDNNNNLVAAGVYFYKLTAEGKTASKKIVVVR